MLHVTFENTSNSRLAAAETAAIIKLQCLTGQTRRAAERVVKRMAAGEPMVWHHGTLRSIPVIGGSEVAPKVAAALIREGIAVPREDGLFPGMSQTFALAGAE